MENKKTYWRGVEELNKDPEFLKHAYSEFPEYVPMKEQNGGSDEGDGTNRRDFLKLLGFGLGAVTLAACEAPVKKAIPYLDKPEDIEPGIANYYATTYVDGGDYCSVLVKTREGRPIKIEGNKLSPISLGSTGARVQASVLSLYDSTRLQSFMKGKTSVSSADWAGLDKEIISALSAASSIRIVSQTILSPSVKAILADFKVKYPSAEVVQYDPVSASGLLAASALNYGQRIIPTYDFSKAKTIVSLGADFLGTWLSPGEYSRQFGEGRKLGKSKKEMNRLYVFESNLSLTGSNADYRQPIKPSEELKYAQSLLKLVTGGEPAVKNEKLKKAANDLLNSKGASLVVSGSNDVNVQVLVNEINNALSNYGTTIDLNSPSYFRQGDDEAMNKFIDEVIAGSVDGVIFYNANPVYDHPRGAELKAALSKVKTKIAFNERVDETSELCDYLTPDTHYLESWGDANPRKGYYSLIQPTINPVYSTRSAAESLLIWSGANSDYYSYLTSFWNSNILNGASWSKALHDGVFKSEVMTTETLVFASNAGALSTAESAETKGAGIELKLYEKIGIGSGSQAANPWLQELPDPISKVTWDNYLAVPVSYARDKGLTQGSVVKVTAGKYSVNLPVLIQPGQAKDTVSIAVGYGRKIANKPKEIIGANAFPFASFVNNSISFSAVSVNIEPTGEFRELAQTQTHDTIMDRPVVQETTLAQFLKDPMKHRFQPMVTTPDGKKKPSEVSLWVKEHEKPNHLWQMAIDLNTCFGCGACVVACQAENNIAVVGRDEVIRRREMHWIRIDRYYSSDADSKEEGKFFGKEIYEKEGNVTGNELLEKPNEDNPQVVFMPMLCQHCNHAPCETVCPVAATSHSSEGLNQMAYNRCFGTRYCANNCPYKVRRFNWFKYFDNADRFPENISMNTSMGRMVLNPDVTVRSRGVMEKCSMCVQRIQEGKLTAKKAKTPVKDGAINVACASACPTDAITFGDFNDKSSRVYKQKVEENPERAYAVLEELNVQPNIHYLSKIRNNEA